MNVLSADSLVINTMNIREMDKMIESKPKEPTLKIWAEGMLFISSYLPLFLILLIQDIAIRPNEDYRFSIPETGYSVSWVALIFFLASFFLTWVTNSEIRKHLKYEEGGQAVRVSDAVQIKGDMINYTLPFLIGLFAFDYSSWQNITSMLIFLAFMFAFLRKDGGILLNPMLMLIGVRLYRISYKEVNACKGSVYTRDVLCMGKITAPSITPVIFHDIAGIGFLHNKKDE
jgi:hypothetical protein